MYVRKLNYTNCLFFGILFISSLYAGQPLVCEEPIKDFGTIEEGEKISHIFIIRNASTDIVDVKETMPSCGCIVTSQKEFKLQPNESTDIKVEFDSNGAGGMTIFKNITVCPKDEKNKPLILTVKADVKGIPPEKRVAVIPDQKIIDDDPNKIFIFQLQVPSDPNVKFSIEIPEWLTYTLQKSKYNDFPGVVNWDVGITLKTKQHKKLSGDIIVRSNVPRFEKIKVPVKMEPKPMFRMSPYMLVFDSNEPNQSKDITLTSTDHSFEAICGELIIKSTKECIELKRTNKEKFIYLTVTNKSCDRGFGKIELKVGDEIVGMIPMVFK